MSTLGRQGTAFAHDCGNLVGGIAAIQPVHSGFIAKFKEPRDYIVFMVRYVDIFDSDVPEESLEVRGNHVSIISPIAVKRHVGKADPIRQPRQFTAEAVTKAMRRPTEKNLERLGFELPY